ncbi:MAG: hypothetical protein RL022_1702 [Chloroflexota bacterium]|jgi:hypothetical protein
MTAFSPSLGTNPCHDVRTGVEAVVFRATV